MPLWFGPQPPTVDLSWTASPSPTVTNYKVYRSLVSGGPYTLANLIDVTSSSATSFHDFQVFRNTTYFYVVTSFDGNLESILSNEASALTRS